jgi:uncharacterized membrane protein YcaP (DUF421 family)
MESVMRGLIVYGFLLVIFRIAGKRTLSEASTFDLVLLLIISETTQQAMVDDDHSMTTAGILISTLVSAAIALSLLKQSFPAIDTFLEGKPVLLLEDGLPLKERLARERVDEDDILEAARLLQGLESLDQIKYAVLERDGNISIVPK